MISPLPRYIPYPGQLCGGVRLIWTAYTRRSSSGGVVAEACWATDRPAAESHRVSPIASAMAAPGAVLNKMVAPCERHSIKDGLQKAFPIRLLMGSDNACQPKPRSAVNSRKTDR